MRNKTARKSRRSSSVAAELRKFPRHRVPKPSDPDRAAWLQARARLELQLLADALAGAPVLDRDAESREQFPFNGVASTDPVGAVIETLVRLRTGGNRWNDVHTPMCKADTHGSAYQEWIDALRDVSFQAGVEYALRGGVKGGR